MTNPIHKEGDQTRRTCFKCNCDTLTTFRYRDVPLSDSGLLVKNILVGVCDRCDSTISIPSQSVENIKEQRRQHLPMVKMKESFPFLVTEGGKAKGN